MRERNEYLSPGVWVGDRKVVVLDVVTHTWNSDAGLQEALSDPLVVVRSLEESFKIHERDSYPLSVFKQKFSKE
jgi:hypothetical protein